MANHSQKRLTIILKDSGLRNTTHRLNILTYLSKSRHPVTVYTLVDDLQKKRDIDQATVYRNLTTLHEAKLIRRLDFNHGHAHYELETGNASHSLVCGTCETIEKIEGVSADETVIKMLKKSKKFSKTDTHSIEIYGVCKNCI